MNTAKPGLLERFRAVAGSELSKTTMGTYSCWLRKFYAHTRRGAATWTGADISAFIAQMERDVARMLGHDSIETTQIYSHADEAPGTSPLDVQIPGRAKRQYTLHSAPPRLRD